MRKKITTEDINYMTKYVSQGYTIKSIAKQLGVSETTVHKYTKGTIKTDPLAKNKK